MCDEPRASEHDRQYKIYDRGSCYLHEGVGSDHDVPHVKCLLERRVCSDMHAHVAARASDHDRMTSTVYDSPGNIYTRTDDWQKCHECIECSEPGTLGCANPNPENWCDNRNHREGHTHNIGVDSEGSLSEVIDSNESSDVKKII